VRYLRVTSSERGQVIARDRPGSAAANELSLSIREVNESCIGGRAACVVPSRPSRAAHLASPRSDYNGRRRAIQILLRRRQYTAAQPRGLECALGPSGPFIMSGCMSGGGRRRRRLRSAFRLTTSSVPDWSRLHRVKGNWKMGGNEKSMGGVWMLLHTGFSWLSSIRLVNLSLSVLSCPSCNVHEHARHSPAYLLARLQRGSQ